MSDTVYTVSTDGKTIKTFTDHQEAKWFAEEHANSYAKVTRVSWWNEEYQQTFYDDYESRATAEYLEIWARNDSDVCSSYFAPLAKETARRYKQDRDKAHDFARNRAVHLAEYAAIRYNREQHRNNEERYWFRADVIRECADSIAAYIITELDLNGTWD